MPSAIDSLVPERSRVAPRSRAAATAPSYRAVPCPRRRASGRTPRSSQYVVGTNEWREWFNWAQPTMEPSTSSTQRCLKNLAWSQLSSS